MVETQVCRVCLSDSAVNIVFNDENDILMKLRRVGGVPITEDDHLPQLICQTCFHELQLAYDFISHVEATCNKPRTVCLDHKNAKEIQTSVNVQGKKQIADVKTIQEERQAENTLVAEIVVKEETFSNDEQRFEIFEIKEVTGCKTNVHKYETKVGDASDRFNDRKKSCELEKNYLEEIDGRKRDNADRGKGSNAFSYVVWPIESQKIDTIVKEEIHLANESFGQVECSEEGEKSYAIKLGLGYETCEAATLSTNNQYANENEINQSGLGNIRFQDDETKSMERNKLIANRKASMKKHPTRTTSLSKDQLNILQQNEIFTNESLGESLSNSQQLHKLQKEHSKPHSFVDDQSRQSFPNEQQLETQQMGHMNSAGGFKCEQCGKAFSSEVSLKHHQKRHSNPKMVSCEECGKSFITELSLNEHRMLHSNPDAFKCDQCDKRFSSSKRLGQHIRAHLNPKEIKCEKCNKSFPYLKLLEEHQMRHSNPDLFKCDQCNKRYTSKKCLEQHKIAHLNPELLTCKQCNKSFKYLCSLKEHQLLHSNPDAFNCDICGKKFLHRSKLKAHQILHLNPEMLRCKQCEKTFEYVYSLREHEILHSNPDAFKCEVCEKRYSYKNSLVAHRKTHSNSKFTCDDSEKSIANEPAMEQYSSI